MVGLSPSEGSGFARGDRARGPLIPAVRPLLSVRFTGMCCGCPYKALTWRGTVYPMLSQIEGVTIVDAPGIRISEEAEERLQRYAATPYEPMRTGSAR